MFIEEFSQNVGILKVSQTWYRCVPSVAASYWSCVVLLANPLPLSFFLSLSPYVHVDALDDATTIKGKLKALMSPLFVSIDQRRQRCARLQVDRCSSLVRSTTLTHGLTISPLLIDWVRLLMGTWMRADKVESYRIHRPVACPGSVLLEENVTGNTN